MLDKSDLREIKLIVKTELKKELDPVKYEMNLLKRAVISLENTQKYYSDMFYSNKDNIVRLARRINTIEGKVGINSTPKLAVSGI